jgi:AraC-like DNA-binding protein
MTDSSQSDRLPHRSRHIGENYADSFATCREVLAPMFELDTPSAELRAGYSMDFEMFDFGPIKLAMATAPASIMVRSPQTIARTGTDHFHVQFYRRNGFVMTIDGAEQRVAEGQIAMFDMSRPITLHTDGVDNLSVMISRDLLSPLIADPADVHGLVLRHDSEANIAVREHLQDMWSQGPHLTVEEGLELSHATTALLAAVIRANSQSSAATRAELRKSQFRAICRRIDRQIGDPSLGPTALAHHFHVTRPTLYRMFEPHGGIGKYILGRRLTGVFRDLSDPLLERDQIGAILYRWGFSNHTAAGRAFRAAYGMTPSEARSQALEVHPAERSGKNAFDLTKDIPASVKAFES